MSTKLTYRGLDLAEATVSSGAVAKAEKAEVDPAYALIELFFFAYRDFVSDPDRILAEYGFGRAHHRVLHFVTRRPGMTIAELLDILKITKQSLNRVLKELIEKGYIVQRAGQTDRRQRLLWATEAGRELALRMARLQTKRIARALEGEEAEAVVSRFLIGMLDPVERAKVRKQLSGAKLGA
ncbi:MarR family winged helix-turn-helix transcriptional regulator [Enterovirga sp. CN4-39]|uniref:MarR family winged helix-turn-helix transcriptional regulator n=1 Tax=Enterovirga sp. CN4-39 TaxID=3400910 RepID=UPI003BFB4540